MTRPYSVAYKQKTIERMTGKHAASASQLSHELGIPQQTLYRWLKEARALPPPPPPKRESKIWSVEEKIRVLSEASHLDGEELTAFLQREGLRLADLEQWRLALAEGVDASRVTSKRIRSLERELARKDKALAEAAALLVLKKKLGLLSEDEDDDTDEENEK